MQDAVIGARSTNSNETIAPDNGPPHTGLSSESILRTDDANYPLLDGDGDEVEDEDEDDLEEEQLPPAPSGVSSPLNSDSRSSEAFEGAADNKAASSAYSCARATSTSG